MNERIVKKALIVANYLKPEAEGVVSELTDFLSSKGIQYKIFGYFGKPISSAPEEADIAFSLGGDGTVLFAIRVLAGERVPLLPVNLGNFGFITEVAKDEWKETFEEYLAGRLDISHRIMLDVSVIREDETKARFYSLNDAVVSAQGISKMIRLTLELDKTPLGQYRADGVIVATPTGSTANSAAAGGPLLEPEMDALLINPICPFSLSNRALVIPSSKKICITVEPSQRTGVILTVDGQTSFELQPDDRVMITAASEKALIIKSDKRNFYEILRYKLKWSGGPDD